MSVTRTRLYILIFLFLLLTVPWFFFDISSIIVAGFPLWALYTLLATLLYAVVISYFLGKYWTLSSREEEEE